MSMCFFGTADDFQDDLRDRAAEGEAGRAFQVKADNCKRRAPPAPPTIWSGNTLRVCSKSPRPLVLADVL